MVNHLSPTPSTPPQITRTSSANAIFARLVTGALIVMVLYMVGMIYWRDATVHEPSTAIVIGGDGSLEGAQIIVTGNNQAWHVELDKDNGWQSPVLLDPGNYHVTVTHRDHQILNEPFTLTRLTGIRFNLPSMVVILGNPQLADARVDVLRETKSDTPFPPEEIKFLSQDHYQKVMYLYPGTYRAIAYSTSGVDRVLGQVEFTVDRTSPQRPDLGRAVNEQGI